MDKDSIVLARIEDKIEQARSGYYATATGFLDLHEQSLLRRIAAPHVSKDPDVPENLARLYLAGDVGLYLYGGYEDAERCIMIAAPSDMAMSFSDVMTFDTWLSAIRVRHPSGGRVLTHRDYLGSILSLGIERSVVGDILVRSDGADIVIKPEVSDYLMSEYSKAGRTNLEIESIGIEEIMIPEQRVEELDVVISSIRMDNLIAATFGVSRSEAVRAIERGIVSVDHIEVTKPDKRIEPGQVIVLRGKGKALFLGEKHTTKKGKVVVSIRKYI